MVAIGNNFGTPIPNSPHITHFLGIEPFSGNPIENPSKLYIASRNQPYDSIKVDDVIKTATHFRMAIVVLAGFFSLKSVFVSTSSHSL